MLVVDDSPVGCETLTGWSGGSTRQSRTLRLTGDLGPGSSPEGLREGFLVYAVREAEGLVVGSGAAYATTRANVEEVEVSADGTRAAVVVREGAPAPFALGPDGLTATPVALVPGPPIPTRSIEEVLEHLAEEVAGVTGGELVAAASGRENGDDVDDARVRLAVDPGAVRGRLGAEPRCGVELLRRGRPRLTGGGGLPPVVDGDYVAAITEATARLDSATLAVQGPPGTGKTYVGARVIARLVRERGWRIGVVAQSHAVVENLLDEVIAAGLEKARVGKMPKDLPTVTNGIAPPPWTIVPKPDYARFLAEHAEDGCVLGGTVWDLTNRKRIGDRELDLLVVDEAGQFSLANTLAASTASQRLLLLGDPQQLPQVTQGSHDEAVDTSALSWIAGGAATMPADRGYFIERTWRLHPDLCSAVSALSYDGRLLPQPVVTQRRHLDGIAPGVHRRLVSHRGSSTASPEEADEVVRIVQDVLGRAWTPGGDEHALAPHVPLPMTEVMVVAGYNAQVACVRTALDAVGLTQVRVGTVDRYQGQEAAVAIVTLAASSATDAPRGLEFLLNRNRLNVAISRAKWAAYVVHSPGLTDALPHGGQALADLGAFRRLMATAHPSP
ncbi:DEAD/DEAH box helicase [Serinibacter arcticus]|uniref:DEAD/DEAH box helicase n=1 Tax=Serinibacter arcticus TaxID=1655435 RepID=UPI001304BF95|nr:AAA domain-containing protein [Serinibacter arcticus]